MHQFQPARASGQTKDDDVACRDGTSMSEREFSTFTRAVTEMFGPEQGRLSAEDWLNELSSPERLPGSTSCEWRRVTIASLARLAIRMSADLSVTRSSYPLSGQSI